MPDYIITLSKINWKTALEKLNDKRSKMLRIRIFYCLSPDERREEFKKFPKHESDLFNFSTAEVLFVLFF